MGKSRKSIIKYQKSAILHGSIDHMWHFMGHRSPPLCSHCPGGPHASRRRGFNMKTNGKTPRGNLNQFRSAPGKKIMVSYGFPHSIIPSFHPSMIFEFRTISLMGKPSLEHLIRDHHFSPSQHGIAWSISAGSGVFYELQRVDPLVGGLVFTRFCHVFVLALACTKKMSIGGSSKFLYLQKKSRIKVLLSRIFHEPHVYPSPESHFKMLNLSLFAGSYVKTRRPWQLKTLTWPLERPPKDDNK